MRKKLLVGAMALALCTPFAPSNAVAKSSVIKIGEVNSYKAQPAFLEPYRKGMELAVQEINDAGGVSGKKLELIIRDDNGNPGDAVRVAEELLSRERVDILAGSFLSNISLALSDFAKQKKVFLLVGEPMTDRLTWNGGNEYTFRIRPGTYTQTAMLIPEAVKLNKKRWAIVYPNYEYGQAATAAFKQLLKEAQPDVEFVVEQAPPLGKVDAGSLVQAMTDAKPDAIFNALFGADLLKFVREGNTRGLFDGREVVSLLTGEPEYLDPLKEETPDGWIVTGYPWNGVDIPQHESFLKAYQARFKDYPRLGSVVGYSMMHAIAAGVAKAGTTETDALIQAFKHLSLDTPFGPITFRSQDNQSTMGTYVGRTKKKDGKGVLVDFMYIDGTDPAFHPSGDEIARARAKN
ncbi:ABC transporter substrate-binding protein [Parapusillimonas granuli]|nr:branched-chain amino acid transport system substrate-binding protein [Parapusillimonas granuli]